MGGTSTAARVTRFLASRRAELNPQSSEFSYAAATERSSDASDVEFEFLDDGNVFLAQSCGGDRRNEMELDEDEDEENDGGGFSAEENRSFWDNQHQILQANICRTSSLESRIRHITKEALQEIQSAATACGCGGRRITAAATTCCQNCLMREVSRRLQKAGYDSAICKTKWRSSPDIPSGEHNFLDVIDNTSSKKGEVRVMIELNFRAEFEMARGSDDYNRLVRRLPEVFVGKVERLSNIIKILCMGAKRCMKEKRMHMGPWRKHRYMQAKWLGPCERNTSTIPLSMGYPERNMPKAKPRASMLTVDLLDIPSMHCTAVEVL